MPLSLTPRKRSLLTAGKTKVVKKHNSKNSEGKIGRPVRTVNRGTYVSLGHLRSFFDEVMVNGSLKRQKDPATAGGAEGWGGSVLSDPCVTWRRRTG